MTIPKVDALTHTWSYGGPKKPMDIPKVNVGNYILEKASFIINASSPLKNKKTRGPICCYTYEESQVIDYQLDVIRKICKEPQIIYIGGIDINKVAKNKRRSEFIVVENQLYKDTNNATDLRMGINASIHNDIFWIHGNLIPTVKTFQNAYRTGKQSTVLYHSDFNFDRIGVHFNKYQIVTDWTFSSNYKSLGIFYISKNDSVRIKRKVAGVGIRDNLFDYEILTDYNLLAVEDDSNLVIHLGN